MEAFRTAVAMGASGIELDARRTNDDQLVVHHDALIADGRAIVSCRRAELPAYIPSLAEALDSCSGAFVNIEIKNDPSDPDFDERERTAEYVMAALAERTEPATNWLISSFRMEAIDRCCAIDRIVPTAWLTFAPVGEREAADVARRGHQAIHPWDPTVDEVMIGQCHDRDLIVNAWTCNDTGRALHLAMCGIDGICTDVPDELLAALPRR